MLYTDHCIKTEIGLSVEVKVRSYKNISYNGENVGEVFKRALVAARSAGYHSVMIHHSNS